MPTVTDVNLYYKIALNNGFKCRAIVTIEDDQLETEIVEINSIWYANEADIISDLSIKALDRVKRLEENKYLDEIAKGNNPFIGPTKFNDKNTLLKKIIKRIISIDDPREDLVYNGYNLISTLSDVQIQTMFPSITGPQLTNLRNQVQKIINVKSELDSYTGMEIE